MIVNGLINLTQIATWHFPKGVDFEGLQIICQIISVITYSNKKVGYGGQGNTQVGIRAIPSTYTQKREALFLFFWRKIPSGVVIILLHSQQIELVHIKNVWWNRLHPNQKRKPGSSSSKLMCHTVLFSINMLNWNVRKARK